MAPCGGGRRAPSRRPGLALLGALVVPAGSLPPRASVGGAALLNRRRPARLEKVERFGTEHYAKALAPRFAEAWKMNHCRSTTS